VTGHKRARYRPFSNDPFIPGFWIKKRKKIKVQVDDEDEELVVDRYVYKPDPLLGDLAEMLGVPLTYPYPPKAVTVRTKRGHVLLDAEDVDEEEAIAIAMALMA
jgi:hypothetical protein